MLTTVMHKLQAECECRVSSLAAAQPLGILLHNGVCRASSLGSPSNFTAFALCSATDRDFCLHVYPLPQRLLPCDRQPPLNFPAFTSFA